MLPPLFNLLPVFSAAELLAIVVACCAAISDLQSRTISNNLVVAAIVTALPIHLLATPWPHALQLWSLGALTGLLSFLPFYILRGMAAGDVKLMAAVGAFVGPALAFHIALNTFLVGGCLALIIILINGKMFIAWCNIRALLMQITNHNRDLKNFPHTLPYASVGNLPYATAIAIGTMLGIFLQT
jgi:prepilin peptidase CpaA